MKLDSMKSSMEYHIHHAEMHVNITQRARNAVNAALHNIDVHETSKIWQQQMHTLDDATALHKLCNAIIDAVQHKQSFVMSPQQSSEFSLTLLHKDGHELHIKLGPEWVTVHRRGEKVVIAIDTLQHDVLSEALDAAQVVVNQSKFRAIAGERHKQQYTMDLPHYAY